MILSTDYFTYTSNKVFVTELSDLPQPSTGSDLFHRLYPHSADIGLTLVSAKTKCEATYYLAEEVYTDDEDHEFTHYVLLPTPETIRKYPRLAGTSIHLYND